VATDDAEALTELYTQSAKIGVTLLNMDVEKKRYYDTSKKDGGYTDEQHTVGALVELELLAHADPLAGPEPRSLCSSHLTVRSYRNDVPMYPNTPAASSSLATH